MTPPCGTPSRIFTLLLKWPSSFTLADLSCRKHRIHLIILPETLLSSIFSRGPSRQTLSKGFVRSKKTETTFFFSWKAFSISWAMRADLLCYCVSDIRSVLVTVFCVLQKMISIFCWLLALEVFQGNLRGWWGGSCLGLSCLYLFLWIGMMVAFFHKAGTVPFFHDSLKSSRSVFLAAGPRCLIMSFVIPSGPGAFLHFNCFIAASISFVVMSWLMQLSDVDCFCSYVSCSQTWQVLSLGSLTLLSSWYNFARQLAASFWTISSPFDCRTVWAFPQNSSKTSFSWPLFEIDFHATHPTEKFVVERRNDQDFQRNCSTSCILPPLEWDND